MARPLSRDILGPAARAFYDQQKAAAPGPTRIQTRTRKGIRDSKRDALEFLNLCERGGVPKPQLEFRFHSERMWRFDFAWLIGTVKLALEVDGGVFIPGAGRHNSGAGFSADCEKLNSACVLGWRILRVQPRELLTFETLDLVKRALRAPR